MEGVEHLMANTKPPVRVSSEDNKIIRQQALPIKMGYYDKYPDAMRILESPVYGKNEIVLQALQFMYDCFPIEMVSRESAKALSTAMGFDKNGNRLEVKIRGRKRKNSFSSNIQNLSSFKSGSSQSKPNKESNKLVQSQPEASNESKKVESIKEEKKAYNQVQKNDNDRQQKLRAEQEAQARKRAEAEAEAKRRAEEEAMKAQRPEAEVENGEDDYMTFEPDMSFFTPPKELVPEESEKPVVPQRPQRDPNKFKVF